MIVRPNGHHQQAVSDGSVAVNRVYALTGASVITYKERLVKETIVEALEEICE